MVTRGLPRAIVGYDNLLGGWRSSFDRLSEQTGQRWPLDLDAVAPQIVEFLSPGLRHHSRSIAHIFVDPLLRSWVGETYQALQTLEVDPQAENATADLDRIRRESQTSSGLRNARIITSTRPHCTGRAAHE